jgi:opacity protein-like surface antigen
MRRLSARWHLGLSTLLVAAMPATAQAQFQVKAGVTFATVSTEDTAPDLEGQTGWAAGIGMGFKFGGILAFQPELLWVQKGAQSGDASLKVNYAEIPLLLRVDIPLVAVVPYVIGGGYVDFRLSSDCSGVENCLDQIEEPSSTDYGAVLGAGLRLGGTTGLSLEVRYDLGLKNIEAAGEGFDTKNRTVLVLAGLSF